MGRKKTDKIVFENVEILDAGAKGVSVAKAPDGKVILFRMLCLVMWQLFKHSKKKSIL